MTPKLQQIENKIYVFTNEENKWTLRFTKCNIETKAYIGRNGVTNQKLEGDGKTPKGEFLLGNLLGKNPNIKNINGLKYEQINPNMYWIDDPQSKYYNKLVDISKTEKDWNSAEHLIEYPIQYEYLIEIKTNPNNIPGKGSAIFLHCIKNGLTAGCIAIDKEAMKIVMENIDKQTKIKI